jgi:hypothetical protein
MTKYFHNVNEVQYPYRLEKDGIKYYDVTEARVGGYDYDAPTDSEFAREISKEEYEAELKPLRKMFLRHQMLEHLKEFNRAADKVDTTWQKMDSEDWDLLATDYPFHDSFDDLNGEIDCWVATMEKLFGRRKK